MDIYFARQQVFERLQQAKESLPKGSEPQMGPISTGLGEVFQYILEAEGRDLTEIRAVQDWIVQPILRTVPGVADINSFGGKVNRNTRAREKERRRSTLPAHVIQAQYPSRSSRHHSRSHAPA